MPSYEPESVPKYFITALIFQVALNEQGRNHYVIEESGDSTNSPRLTFIKHFPPLVKGMRLWGSGHEELSEMFGLFCCSESVRGEEGSYPGLMSVTVCRLQASPHRWTCIVDSWCASARAKKPFTFIISVVPKCWSADSSDSVMTFSTDCS